MNNTLNQFIGKTGLTKTKGVILASLVLGAAALSFLGAVQTVKANDDHRGDSDQGAGSDALQGTWIVQVSLDPATFPSPLPPGVMLKFTRLETYDVGGGVVASNNGPGAGGPAGQGNWTAVGHHQFAATELRLGFTAANVFTGISKIRSRLALNKNGDEFDAIIQTDIYLPDGTLLPLHPAGTSHGVRVPIEPLN
ncbi:MAG: hypothetical protein JWM99_3983 [Verrucomicrobiales bacterium]|nr:hypothetical protein [Verrucomicrobiales bacterium]